MTTKEILQNTTIEETKARNIMGCSENWYNEYYAIQQTFTKEEIEAMSEKEVDDLVRLANEIQYALY